MLQRLQLADFIIINEISMTFVQLFSIYSRLKQAFWPQIDPFKTEIMLYIGDMEQLCSICPDNVTDMESICQCCCIMNSPLWYAKIHFQLQCSILNAKDPKFIYFFQHHQKTTLQPRKNLIQFRHCHTPLLEEYLQYHGHKTSE